MAIGLFITSFLPKPVHAGLPVSDIGSMVQSAGQFIKNTFDKIQETLLDELAVVFFNNIVQTFVNNLAAETAQWIASGDEGQKPLLFTSDWQDYLEKAGEDAIAFAAIGFADAVGLGNICIAPEIAIDIILPQIEQPGTTKPRCSLDDLKKTWDVTSPDFLQNFTLSFQTDQNDIGIAISFLANLEKEKTEKKEAAENERDQSPFKAVKDAISGLTETPAPLVQKQVEKVEDGTTVTTYTYTNPIGVLTGAIQVFAGTLMGQYLNKLQSGFFSLADAVPAEEDVASLVRGSLSDPLSTGPTGSQTAQLKFTDVFKPNLRQANDFNILAELAACPSEVRYASIYNCVIDSGFMQALSGGRNGFLTVREAVQQNLLHGNWVFGYVNPGSGAEPSYLNGYAYSNMKKLRRLRIVPVGWEMAALRARSLGQSVTLLDVINSYNDQGSPFYKLVDPEWVLKVPTMRCAAKAPGQILQSGGTDRVAECVDIQDCIAFGDDGECRAWAYCTADQREWRFPAEQCPEHYATCEQFYSSGEDTTQNLWLSSTLEYEGCNAQTAGCTWYSTVKNSAGEWQETNRVHLTSAVQACDPNDAGCHLYIRMGNGSNLIRNGSFEDDAGHNYVLGLGDTVAENSIPDGWSARQALISLNDDAQHGEASVRIQPQPGGECRPGLQYEAPLGHFEIGQQYTLSGRVRTENVTPADLQLFFQGITFTVEDVNNVWKSFAFTFVMPSTTRSYTFVLAGNNGDCANLNPGGAVFYDAIQLERNTLPTSYKEYGSVNQVSLKNAPACTFEDVGCQRYLPVDRKNAATVTGVATGQDLCPAECVGYATYEQQETDLEPERIVNFIPSSADVCSAQEVGCEQFTNLDVVARGGEGLEYYSQIRHCEKPQPQCQTYFAWEGSDVTGFQLVNFSLLAINEDGTGVPQTTDGSVTCDPNDADCRELIGEDGSRSFRNLSKTITCSEACVPLRARPGLVNEQECIARLGEWDALTQRCVFQAIASESRVCRAEALGCREYLGTTGHNVAVVLAENFENGTIGDWINASLSTESVKVGGHSMKLGNQQGTINAETRTVVEDIAADTAYTLELNARASVSDFLTVTAYLGNAPVEANRIGSFVTGTLSWNKYRLGPITTPTELSGVQQLILVVEGASNKPDIISLFADDITLRRINSSLYLAKDSWETPNTCETNPPLAGGSASRSMVGCQAYRIEGDTSNQTQFLKSFTRLCSEDKIGCEALIDTHNSVAPYREVYQPGNLAEVVVPEDSVTYLVNRKEYRCQAEQVGCMELGKPVFDQNNQITSFNSVYLKNNPDQYASILCPQESLRCEAFTNSRNEVVYAKNPGLQQCEYREVPNSFPVRYAWFKVGGTEENPVDCLQAKDNSYVNRCVPSAVSCTQFYEPITQQSYYYKKSTLPGTAASECNGVVDWKKGCVLFDDQSVRSKYFKSGDDIDIVGAAQGCQTGDVGCNTNTLLRVQLDRVCSQWLTGVSSGYSWDQNLQTYKSFNYDIGRCLEYDPLNPAVCLQWDNADDKPLLTEEFYKNRDTSWVGDDYTGYSIPFAYPVETLKQYSLNITEDGTPSEYRLAYLEVPPNQQSCLTSADCPQGGGIEQVCRLELNPDSGDFQGSCFINRGISRGGTASEGECRAYPENDSPFPPSVATFYPDTDAENPGGISSVNPLFANANIGTAGENVECNYVKAYYAGDRRYYSLDTIIPSTITVRGEPQKFDKKEVYYGWEGYCLERDNSRIINGDRSQTACLTWYPVDLIQGARDLNNTDINAGYYADHEQTMYCAQAVFAEYLTPRESCGACPSPHYETIVQRSGTCTHPFKAPDLLESTGTRFLNLNETDQTIIFGLVSFFSFGAGASIFQALAAFGVLDLASDLLGTDEYPEVTCIPRYGEGWYPKVYPNPPFDPENPNNALMCSVVARIQSPAGVNKAYTDRIHDTEYIVPELGWTYIQQNVPFGSVRAGTEKLEELVEPLLLKPATQFVECNDCRVPGEDPENPDPLKFGVCQDRDPNKKGRPCPLFPNAGSPYSLLSLYPQWANNDWVRVRADNQVWTDQAINQPYTRTEQLEDGTRRLQELFAKSYGVWYWQLGFEAVCVGTCQGGPREGEFCKSVNECGDTDSSIAYTCQQANQETGLCVGGVKHTYSCTSDLDCSGPAIEDLQTDFVDIPGFNCVEAPDDANSVFICEGGPWKGNACQTDADCAPPVLDGKCDFTQNRCVGQVNGQTIWSANSGQICNNSAECNAVATCRVDRCSTEIGKPNTGLCDGLQAGQACGDSSGRNQYVQDDAIGWDLIRDNPSVAEPPVIQPTIPDSTSPNGYAEGFIANDGGFSVNGRVNGTITSTEGRAPVTVSFYAYNSNGEQMPLRVIMVDWGDNTDLSTSVGSFKNHKHVCRRSCSYNVLISCDADRDCQNQQFPDATCNPENFGDSLDACVEDTENEFGFFSFSHTYTCEGATDCVYTPRVLVRDNWGAVTRVTWPGQIVVSPRQ